MPELARVEILETAHAVLNITWAGQNGDLPDPILYDSTDTEIRQWATEAVRQGVPGIAADATVNFTDFVVERFQKTGDLPNRVVLRPKTPFGCLSRIGA